MPRRPGARVGASPLAADPVVAAAMAAHGHTADSADWRDYGQGPEVAYPARDGAPNVHVDGGYAYVRWWRADGHIPMYERLMGAAESRKIRLPRMSMPDTVLAALPGRRLRDVVDIPGDPGLVIAEIHVEKLGEFRDTVITLREAEAE